jgi:predicted phage terminase large subunit-like protein
MTRWSHLDLVGRLEARAKETGEHWEKIFLPAIADADEDWPQWNWSRKKGDVLCPEMYSQATMENRQRNTLPFWWATMYMQQPHPREGGEFHSSWFKIVKQVPSNLRFCRSWDLAGTKDKSAAQTAGVKIGYSGSGEDRQYYITDVVADWWGSGERDKEIKQIARTDGRGVDVIVEQEPGSGGKIQAEAIQKKLDGFSTHIVVAGSEGSKLLRADPLASAAHAGKLFLLEADWNEKLLAQVRRFPGGKPIDIVDAAAQGYNWLADQEDIIIPSDYAPEDDVPSRSTRV